MGRPRTAFTLALALVLGGCLSGAAPKAKPDKSATTAGQLLARSACPIQVRKAEAWRNKMPAVGDASTGAVSVVVEFQDSKSGAVVLRSDASTDDTLVLDLRAGESAMTGRVDYREERPQGAYKRVVLRCRGGDIFVIGAIESVY